MRTKVITVCIFFELVGLICLISAVFAYFAIGEAAVLDGGISWTLVTTGLVCGIPALIYMVIFSWWSLRKRREQVDRLMAGEDPNVVLKGTPRSEVDKIMENIRLVRESQERDRLSQDEERRRLEIEIKNMDDMLRQTQLRMAEEYRLANAESMAAQQAYLAKQAEDMERAYKEAFKQQQEELMKQNSPNYRNFSETETSPSVYNTTVAVSVPGAAHGPYDSTFSSHTVFPEYAEPTFTEAKDERFMLDDAPTPDLPMAAKADYDKLLSEQVDELTTARDSYAEMSQEQLETLARALAEDVIRDKGYMAPQDVEELVRKHRDELQEQKDAYSELTSEKIQTLAHERAVEALRAQGYMSPTQVNELLTNQKASAMAELLNQEQIEELAHKRALEIANEKVAASKEDMEALALEMARKEAQQQIEQIEAEKFRLEEEKRLLDAKRQESDNFAKQQLESALLGKNQLDILQAEHLRVEATLREKERKENERWAKQKIYKENRLQAELARKQMLSRTNIEKLIHKFFMEVSVCFLMDREDYKRRYGIAPYNRVIMQPASTEGAEPTAKYIMASTEDRLYRFAEVLVDVERFFLHPQLYAMYNELIYARTPLVLVSERLHHMYLQFHRKDFVRDYRHKPNFDNLLILVSNHFSLRSIKFKTLFAPPYPFDRIENIDDDAIIEYLGNGDRQKAFEEAFPHYIQMGFENVHQAMYVGFIESIKDKMQPLDLFPIIIKDTARIAKLLVRQENAKAKKSSSRKTSPTSKRPKEALVENLDEIFDKVPEEYPVDALKGILEEMPDDIALDDLPDELPEGEM